MMVNRRRLECPDPFLSPLLKKLHKTRLQLFCQMCFCGGSEVLHVIDGHPSSESSPAEVTQSFDETAEAKLNTDGRSHRLRQTEVRRPVRADRVGENVLQLRPHPLPGCGMPQGPSRSRRSARGAAPPAGRALRSAARARCSSRYQARAPSLPTRRHAAWRTDRRRGHWTRS